MPKFEYYLPQKPIAQKCVYLSNLKCVQNIGNLVIFILSMFFAVDIRFSQSRCGMKKYNNKQYME